MRIFRNDIRHEIRLTRLMKRLGKHMEIGLVNLNLTVHVRLNGLEITC